MKKVLLFLLVFLSLNVFSLVKENTFYIKSEGKRYSFENPSALIDFERFKEEYPEAEARWNEVTGTISELQGFRIKGEADDVIMDLLINYPNMFGVNPKEIQILSKKSVDNTEHIYAVQMMNGLKVYGTNLTFHFVDNLLTYISENTYPRYEKLNQPLEYRIKPEEYSGMIKRLLNSKDILFFKTEKVVYYDYGIPKPSYFLYVISKEPYGEYNLVVDGTSLKVFEGYPALRTTSGYVKGMVFPSIGTDALAERPFQDEYIRIDGTVRTTTDVNGYYNTSYTGTVSAYLQGPYCNAQNEDTDEAYYSSSGGSVDYTVSSVTYSWVSTSTATGITGDDQSKQFTLPFTFNFYGTNYTSVYVCSNGFLSFTSNSTAYNPSPIPNTGVPNALIAPLWRDLNPSAGGTITYYSGSDKFVVTWSGVKNYSNSSTQTFQVILYPNGEIVFQYNSITNDVTTTRGIENIDGTTGKTIGTPSNGTAYKFTPSGGGGSTSWTWSYSTSDTHIDEVNVFYHVNLYHYWVKNTLGYNGMDYQMKATVHVGTNYANAYYSPSDKNIYFGDGDNTNIKITSRARDVIYHEYTHGVTDHIYRVDTGNSSALPYTGQSGAIDEGYSDYFAASFTNDPIIGEWVMASQYQRNLENLYKYPDDYVNEVHDDSRIISGAFWDIRKSCGQAVADKIIFKAEFYYPDDFNKMRTAVLKADSVYYSGSHTNAIVDAFARHGIGSGSGGTSGDYTLSSVTYSWVSTSTATGITGDDQSKQFTLPFTFNFYGTNYTSVYVCSNGFLSFTSNSTAYNPSPIPNTGVPNAIIAPLWRDLNPSAGGTITYYSGSDKFVVTWNGIKNYASPNNPQTFQVILYPNGEIVFQYNSITNDVTTTRGIENADGTKGLPYSTNPSNGTAVKFTPSGSSGTWTEVSYNVSSPHPYTNNYDNTWTITKTGATKMKVYFSSFETEAGYDFVYILDGNNNQVARYDGSKSPFWSAEVSGSTIKIRLVTDYSVTKNGFDITKYAWYGTTLMGLCSFDGGKIFEIKKIITSDYIEYIYNLDEGEIEVYNITGMKIEGSRIKRGNGFINLKDKPNGVYFVIVKGGDFKESFKVYKVK